MRETDHPRLWVSPRPGKKRGVDPGNPGQKRPPERGRKKEKRMIRRTTLCSAVQINEENVAQAHRYPCQPSGEENLKKTREGLAAYFACHFPWSAWQKKDDQLCAGPAVPGARHPEERTL